MARRKRSEVEPEPVLEPLTDDDVRDRFWRRCNGCGTDIAPRTGLLLTCRSCLGITKRKASW